MDEVISVKRSFLNKIRGFLNLFASRCSECLRRSGVNCTKCEEVSIARTLIVEVDGVRNAERERYFIDNPFMEKAAIAMDAIESAGRPISSTEIKLGDVSRQYKNRILRRMVKIGILTSSKPGDGQYFYERGPRFDIFKKQTQVKMKG